MAGTVALAFLAVVLTISEAVYYCPVPREDFKTDLSRNEYRHGFPVGSKISFYCPGGFKLRGRKVSECLADGWSSESPTCVLEEVVCERREELEYGSISPPKDTFSPGDEITYSCNDGYELVGETTDICLENGNWEQRKMPTCFQVMCKKIRAPSNGRADSNYSSYFPGEEIIFSCDEGYKLEGSRRNKCQNDGKWKYDSTLKCVKFSSCRKRRSPRNGDYQPKLPEYLPGNTITFSCDSGYYLDGVLYNECLENGEWRFDETPNCEAETCSRNDLSEFSKVDPDFQSYWPGDKVEVSCGDGDELVGGSEVVCQENGKWSYLPECRKATTCRKRLSPSNGYYEPDQPVYYATETIVYSCKKGYYLDGLFFNECLKNGNWRFDNTPDCIKGTCLRKDLSEFAKIKPNFNEYLPGNSVEVFCKEGYKLIGDAEVVCRRNGKWADLPKCEKVTCRVPSEPKNGYVSHFLDYKLPGERIEYGCSKGFELKGRDSNVCMKSGHWKYDSPVCVERESCSFRGPPRHGKVSPEIKTHFVGQRILYVCREGYYLDGSEENVCEEGAKWRFSSLPRCRKYCSFKRNELDENLLYSRKQKLFKFGEEVLFTCKSNLEIEGANVLQCEEGGRWSQRVPTCVHVCSKPIVEHGGVEDDDVKRTFYNEGENVRFFCEESYQLENARTGKCLSNGTWSTKALCKLVKQRCVRKEVKNGGMTPNKLQYNVGDRVRYFCEVGHILSSAISSNECTSDGSWKYAVPDCKEHNRNANCRRRCSVRSDYRRYPCQCNLTCRWFKNCCGDYRKECTSAEN